MSIYKRILIWLMPALLLSTAIAAITVYLKTLSEVNEMQDYSLRQTAYSMQYSTRLSPAPSDQKNPPDTVTHESPPDNDDFELIGQVWDKNGELVLSTQTHPEINIPLLSASGISTVTWQNKKWRVFSLPTKDSTIQIVQSSDFREEASADIAESAVIPIIVLVPALGLLIFGGVALGLRPLKRVAADLENRHADSMTPLVFQNLPTEIASMVLSLNSLLKRLSDSMSHQRQFIEDAAHELRTPLTALKLQAEIMSRSADRHEISDALDNLKQGIARSTHLVEQLLSLAHQQHAVKQNPFEVVELEELVKDVIAELVPIANAKKIDLGLVSTEKAYIEGNKSALRTMLVNLVDNSIRYTPNGGEVDICVSAKESGTTLEITDSGAGIPPTDRDRVFDRFYRGLEHGAIGSGLGLAIVKSVVDSHHATIALEDGKNGVGLSVSIDFVSASRAG